LNEVVYDLENFYVFKDGVLFFKTFFVFYYINSRYSVSDYGKMIPHMHCLNKSSRNVNDTPSCFLDNLY